MPTDATFTIQEAEASCDVHNLFAQSHLDAQPLIVPQICISHAALGENADAWPIRGAWGGLDSDFNFNFSTSRDL